jgi:hypothetical protein
VNGLNVKAVVTSNIEQDLVTQLINVLVTTKKQENAVVIIESKDGAVGLILVHVR